MATTAQLKSDDRIEHLGRALLMARIDAELAIAKAKRAAPDFERREERRLERMESEIAEREIEEERDEE